MNSIRIAILVLLGTGSLLGEPKGRGGDGGPSERRGPKGERSFGRFFESADSNSDGVVSLEEFSALERISRIPSEKRNEIFKRFDKDGDGLIQPAEMRPHQRPNGGNRPFPRLHELDTNKDGKVSLDEFEKGPFTQRMTKERLKAFFERLDTNGDGSLSPEDKPKRRGGPQGPPRDRRPQHHDRKKMIETLDQNDDKALSFEEFRQAPWLEDKSEDEQEDLFEKIDKNDDLVIDKSDLPAGGRKGSRGPAGKGPQPDGSKGPRGPEGKAERP